METSFLVLLILTAGSDGPPGEVPVELRALRSYLGVHEVSQASGTGAERSGEFAADLKARLERFLGRSDLRPQERTEAIGIYQDLARSIAAAPATPGPNGGPGMRDVYAGLIRQAEVAGMDPLPIELEMLSGHGAGLDARNAYAAVARLAPRIKGRFGALDPEEASALEGILQRILGETGWPDLESGAALSGTIELLLGIGGASRMRSAPVIAAKLVEWTGRILRAEAARDGEMAQEGAIIHLYRALELSGPSLDEAQWASILEGLVPLLPPVVAAGAGPAEGTVQAAEIGEVRLPSGAVQRIPPLPPGIGPGQHRYLLVPRKAYQVELVCTGPGGEPRNSFLVLARPGAESRLAVPRVIPQGMVPVTLAENGRLAFLADRRPWSVRRFLLAFQRCGNVLAADRTAVQRIWRSSALREIPLGGAEPTFAALVGLLSEPMQRDRLEGTFWVDSRDEAARSAAFEIAGGILSGNTGLRDTALQLPTVAESNRMIRDGEWFGIVDPHLGLFNATRLVPDPVPGSERSRYVVRTVLRIGAP